MKKHFILILIPFMLGANSAFADNKCSNYVNGKYTNYGNSGPHVDEHVDLAGLEIKDDLIILHEKSYVPDLPEGRPLIPMKINSTFKKSGMHFQIVGAPSTWSFKATLECEDGILVYSSLEKGRGFMGLGPGDYQSSKSYIYQSDDDTLVMNHF